MADINEIAKSLKVHAALNALIKEARLDADERCAQLLESVKNLPTTLLAKLHDLVTSHATAAEALASLETA